MRRLFTLLAVLAWLAALPAAASAESDRPGDVVPGVVLVQVEPSATVSGFAALSSPVDGWVRVRVPSGSDPRREAARLATMPGVVAAQPEYLYRPAAVPNDPLYPKQWNLPDIQAPSAWDRSTGAGVVVAVLDTGVARDGEDLTCRTFVAEYNVLTGETGPGAADDDAGHGTHVAGTIAQCTDNGVGVAGTAPDVALMPVRITGDVSPNGSSATSSALAAGIDWAVQNGADVINISFGTTSVCAEGCDLVVDAAIERAVAADVVVVASAGNEPSEPVAYPASHSEVIAVGATGPGRVLAPYSSTGPELSLVAPGGDMSVSNSDGILQESFDGNPKVWGYYWAEGTSMAAPHVAGVAALFRAFQPAASRWQVRYALETAAADLGAPGFDVFYGYGLVQAADTLDVPVAWRYAGADRYATAAAVSRFDFPAGASTAYLATGTDFPDALAGAALAGAKGSPILLTRPDVLSSATKTELGRLGADTVVILGGAGAVSSSVEIELGGFVSTVQRLAGPDRYATAVEISKAGYPSGAPVVYVATGLGFADALAGAAAAVARGGPLLLTDPGVLPAVTRAELERLAPSEIVVLGGPAAVSDAVVAELGAVAPTRRVAGVDRYATAVAASQDAFPAGAKRVYVAVGSDFPDALAGGAAAGVAGGPILLLRSDDIPTVVAAELSRLAPSEIVVLGGVGVVSPEVELALDAYLK